MCSSLSQFPLSLPLKTPFLLNQRFNFTFIGSPLGIRLRKPRRPCSLSASIAEEKSSLEVSWISGDKVGRDDYNGWAIEESAPKPIENKGLHKFAVIGIGASVAGVLGLVAYFSFSSRGFGFRLSSTAKDEIRSEEVSYDMSLRDTQEPEDKFHDKSDAFVSTETSSDAIKERITERIIVPFAIDSTQQEALLALKKLKIIEDDARAEELCTRREYARWLVRTNSQLERSKKHRINSLSALSGSRATAFDDVGVDDPDFDSIQSLAEAGIVRSKLSDDIRDRHANFSPERFISREDLISWKAKIEYEVMPGIDEEMSRKNIGFLDVKEISSDALVELYVDMLADEKSIIRGVFGQSKRLQPSKPCTKGQAAVALTSGRMSEFAPAEISRLEADNISRQNELKEVTAEVLERGEIKQYWEDKIEEEKTRGVELEIEYRLAVDALEQEQSFQETALAEMVKKKASLDCQRQLVSSLKEEITEMSDKLSFEKASYIDEKHIVEETAQDLKVKYENLVGEKSILEAEVEALRILRSWVEDEARKSQARAKVLEEAGRRWKWDS